MCLGIHPRETPAKSEKVHIVLVERGVREREKKGRGGDETSDRFRQVRRLLLLHIFNQGQLNIDDL